MAVIVALGVGTRTVTAQPPTTAAAPRRVPTTVSGTVYDSIARRVIPNVVVEFVNADDIAASQVRLATADSSGRYRISDLPPGKYLAGFFHPALDTLGLAEVQRVVDVAGGSQRVDFGTPSIRTVTRAVCQRDTGADSSGLLLGHVRGTEDERPIAGAVALLEWGELVMDATGIHYSQRRATARTGNTGWFAMCGVPTDGILNARAMNGADSSGYIEVEVPPNGLRHLSFLVGGATLKTIVADSTGTPDSASAQPGPAWRGSARLSGAVRDERGRPLAGAHAIVWGTGLDVMTSERGGFALDSLPGGTHMLEVRVIGYVPVRLPVHLARSRPAVVDVVLDKSAALLPTVAVRGQLVYSRQLAEFERRRRSGFGRFLSSADIEKRPSARLSGLLQSIPGVYISHNTGQATVAMRNNTGGDYCTPTLYVDGMRDMSGDFDLYRADEIAAIEVYNRQAMRPAEFMDMSGCGAVVVWTRHRMPKSTDD